MPRDSDNIYRVGSDADLTATETIAFTLVGGNYFTRPATLRALIPSQAGTSPTLKVTVQTLTDGKEVEVTHTENFDDATTYPAELVLPLPFSDDTAWQVVLTVGGSAGQSFGAVEVWLDGPEKTNVPAA